MHPILFELGPRPIGSYGAMLALGIVVAGFVAARAAHRADMDVGRVLAILACTVGGGLFGSAITAAIVDVARTGSLETLRSGIGLVFYGAVPGGFAAAWIAGRWLRVDIVRLLDLSIPGLAAGHAMGRLGCLLGGCCFGRPLEGAWAIVYTHPLAPAAHPSVPRHPTPLYEAIGLLALALAFALARVDRANGSRALAYLGAYSALRLGTEHFRGDVVRGVWLGVASTSQIVALAALVSAGLGLMLLARARGR